LIKNNNETAAAAAIERCVDPAAKQREYTYSTVAIVTVSV
jgi:hypothetical protein